MKKESVGLFMQNGRNERNLPLYLKSIAEGIKTVSDWDYTSNSMQCSNTERFESDFGNKVLSHEWSAKKILVSKDIAVVAYPEYTDMNKFVIQNQSSGLYSALDSSFSSYDSYGAKRITPFILPRLNKKNCDIFVDSGSNGEILNHESVNLKSLFIIIQYDGYITNPSTGLTSYEPSLDGEVEIFEYDSSVSGIKGSYAFLDGIDYPVLYSRYSEYGETVNTSIGNSNTDLRLIKPDTAEEIRKLPAITTQISNQYGHAPSAIKYSFLGCKFATFVKYTPVVECGRIDLYKKLSGRITSVSSNGRVTSNLHGLKDGNIIRINGARNANGKNLDLNGVKYVQIVDDNTLDLYDDSEMTRKTFTVNGNNPDADWIAVGNVYNETLPDGWQYVKTLTSPTGRNGYLDPRFSLDEGTVYFVADQNKQKTQVPIKKIPAGIINDYYFLLLYDIYGINLNEDIPDNFRSVLSNTNPAGSSFVFTRSPYISSLDTLWASESTFVKGCRFGSDIDLKMASDGSYYLAVGERGSDAPQNTTELITFGLKPKYSPFLYPHHGPYGKVHILKLDIVSNTISDTYVRTINSFDSDTSISKPEPISKLGNVIYQSFYETNNNIINYSQFSAFKNTNSDSFLYNNYWYGSLLYSLKNYEHKLSFDDLSPGAFIYDKDANGGRPFASTYFSNFGIPIFKFENDPENPWSDIKVLGFPNQFYPYSDSFGKSVAISIEGQKIHIATSSRTKTLLEPVYNVGGSDNRKRPDLSTSISDSTYSNLDCGYVHLYTLESGTLNKLGKISHVSQNSISGGIDTIIDKCERYAKNIKFSGNKLYFGSSRSSEFYDKRSQRLRGQPVGSSYFYPSSYNDKSKIFIYSISGNSFSLQKEIVNQNNDARFYDFNIGRPENIKNYEHPNVKECILSGANLTPNKRLYKYTYINGSAVESTNTVDLECIVFPSDRFGDCFELNDKILCANSLDWKNELNINHSDYETFENDPRLMSDYLHLYDNVKNEWTYISKLSASFNSANSKYSYNSINCNNEYLRDLGNYNYENSQFASKTWDYDLTRSFAVLDDRVMIKDPSSYSIFRRSPELQYVSAYSDDQITDCQPYFKFDEIFYANYNRGLLNESCNFYHTKYGSLYKYNESSTIATAYGSDGGEVQFTTPVFFLSIPKNSGNTVNTKAVITLTIESSSFSFPKDIGLKFYKKDPRLNVNAEYVNKFTYNCSQTSADLLLSDTDPSGETIFTAGALSKNPDKIFYTKNYITLGNLTTYTFEVPASIIQEYTLNGSQLQSTTLLSNGHSLILSDNTKTTYNPSVQINNTMMFGIVIEDKNYSVPASGVDIFYSLRSMDFKLHSANLSNSGFDSRSYYCAYDKLLSYHLNISDEYCSGERMMKSVLAAGSSDSVATNCNSLGDISNSINILSVDNIYGDSFSYSPKLSGGHFTSVKSFDVNQLKYLSLHIASNFKQTDAANLFTLGSYGVYGDFTLQSKGSISVDGNTSLFLGPSVYKNNATLFIKTPNVVLEDPSGVRNNNISLYALGSRKIGEFIDSQSNIFLKTVEDQATTTLFIMGPILNSGAVNLVFPGSHTFVTSSNCDSPKLFLFGSYKQDSNITLELSGNKPEAISLNISGPSSVLAAANLHIASNIQQLYDNSTLVCFQKPAQNLNLFIDSPEALSQNTTLFIGYNPKPINSIDNALSSFCNLTKNTQAFDLSFPREELIIGTNSLVDKVYSENTKDFGLKSKTIELDKISSDYEFYRYGRNQSLTHWNEFNLVAGAIENNLPKFYIYSLSNKKVSLQKAIIPYLPASGIIINDSYIQDIKIASWGDIAISYYIEIADAFGNITGGMFEIAIFDINGDIKRRITRTFLGFNEDLFLSNCMGLSLLFHQNKLFFTKESGSDTILVSCQKDLYDPIDTQSFMKDFLSADRAIIENNITKGYVPFNRSAFGHKIEITGSNQMFISAPLFNRFWLSSEDFTPNAVNWGNISWLISSGYGTITSKQITGIEEPITLRVTEAVTAPDATLWYRVTNTEITGNQTTIPSSPWQQISESGTTFSVANNQWVSFCCYGTSKTAASIISVTNLSDSGKTLDSFGMEVTN